MLALNGSHSNLSLVLPTSTASMQVMNQPALSTSRSQRWDPTLYEQAAQFVTTAGDDLIDLLQVAPDEEILDVGCGTGDHVARLAQLGARVQGVDASPDMIEQARHRHPSLLFSVADVCTLPYQNRFHGIFSNACLHWVPQADAAASALFQAPRPGGRLVVEMGAQGNVATIINAVDLALAECGRSQTWQQWYFPSPGSYALLLERHGFSVRLVQGFERPSVVQGHAGSGLETWLTLFANGLLVSLGEQRMAFIHRVEALAAPSLHRAGQWIMDYVRLRVVAERP
jgi:trans-aconitate methyltransferase